MDNEPNQTPKHLEFMGSVLAQTAANDFSGALDAFMIGLEGLVTSRSSITAEEFRYHLAGPLRAVIRYKLSSADVVIPQSQKLSICNFCGKGEQDCERLIAGPDVFICSACVKLCSDIVSNQG